MTGELTLKNHLFPSGREFSNAYRSDTAGHPDRDLRLRTFSSNIGQMTEAAALTILSEAVTVEDPDTIKGWYEDIRNPLIQRVRQIPIPRVEVKTRRRDGSVKTSYRNGTFSNESLYPAYFEMAADEDWMEKFCVLTVNTDKIFGTDFTGKLNSIGEGKKISELDPPSDYSEFRYLVDGVLMCWHLYFDKDTQLMMKQFGTFVADVDLGTTQIDGLFVNPLFDINGFKSNGENGGQLIHDLSRKPIFDKHTNVVPEVLDCSILEVKSIFLARDVAAHPQRKTPRSWHTAQVLESMNKVLRDENVGLAPQYIVLLYLGSLQPNAVYITRTDSSYWINMAGKARSALKSETVNENPELQGYMQRFFDLTSLLAQEARVSEEQERMVNDMIKEDTPEVTVGPQEDLPSLNSEDWGEVSQRKPKEKSRKKRTKNDGPRLI